MTPYLLIFLAALLWALIGVFTAGILATGVGAMEIAFWRALLGGALFVAHGLLAGHLRLHRRRDAGVFVVFGTVGVTLFFSAYNLAIDAGGISLAVVLLYTAPAFVVVLARIFLNETLSAEKLLAVALVIAGVSLVAFGGDSDGVTVSTASVGWGLAAGAGYASFYVVGKKLLVRYHPVAVYAYILPVGALGILPFVEFAPKTATAWGLLALLIVLSTYLAYLVYYMGLRRAEASRAVLVASTEPVIAAVLAAVFFGERFGLWGALGAVMVILASVIGVGVAWWNRSS